MAALQNFERRHRKTLSGWCLLACVFFWAVNAALGRAYSGEVPPVSLALIRWTGSAVLALSLCLGKLRAIFRFFVENPLKVLLLATLNITLYNTLLYLAAETTQAINITLINTLIPPVTVFLGCVVLRSKVEAKGLWGLALAAAGTLAVISEGDPDVLLGLDFVRGDLVMLGAVFGWGLYGIFLGKFDLRLDNLGLFALLNVTGLAPLLALRFLAGEETYVFRYDHLPLFAYLWVFPSLLSNLCWYYGVVNLGAGKASFFIYAMPLFGILIGVSFLDETVRLFHVVGSLMIFLGFCLNFQKKRLRQKS